jgi:DNA-binding transcriptional MerR regulator
MILLLKAFRGREDFTIDELVAVTRDLIRETAISQVRWKVSEYPDVRTIRYYMTTGLLPKPATYEGTAARFGYKHLLILLAIKTLQANYLPLQKIKEIIGSKAEPELETLVRDGLSGAQQGWRSETYENLSHESRPTGGRSRQNIAPGKGADGPGDSLEQPKLMLPTYEGPQREGLTWERLEIESGLELQVRSDFRTPRGSSGINALLSKIRAVLETRQRRLQDADTQDQIKGVSESSHLHPR